MMISSDVDSSPRFGAHVSLTTEQIYGIYVAKLRLGVSGPAELHKNAEKPQQTYDSEGFGSLMDVPSQLQAAAQLQIESLLQLSGRFSDVCRGSLPSVEQRTIALQLVELSSEWISAFRHMTGNAFDNVFCMISDAVSIVGDTVEGRNECIGLFRRMTANEEICAKMKAYSGNFWKFRFEADRADSTHAVVEFIQLLRFFPLEKLIDVSSDDGKVFQHAIRSHVARLPHQSQIREETLPFASRDSVDRIRPGGNLAILAETMSNARRREVSIMPVGRSGVGKSCLINEFLQLPKEVQSPEICPENPYEPQSSVTRDLMEFPRRWENLVVTCVDTPGLESLAKSQQTVWGKIVGRLLDGFSDHSSMSPIDVVWYCLPASLDRLDSVDAQWIRTLAQFIPVVLVLPKAIRSSKAFEHQLDQMSDPLPVVHRLRVLARDDVVQSSVRKVVVESYGLGDLARITAMCLQEAEVRRMKYLETVSGTTDEDFARKRRWSYSVIAGAAASSTTVGIAPIPFADVTLLAPVQIGMITAIIAIYGLSFDKAVVTGLATSLLTSGLASLGGPSMAMWLLDLGKTIPMLNVPASLVCGGIAGGVTVVIGMSVVASLEVLRLKAGNLIGIDHRKFELQVVEEMKELVKVGAVGIAEQFLRGQRSANSS